MGLGPALAAPLPTFPLTFVPAFCSFALPFLVALRGVTSLGRIGLPWGFMPGRLALRPPALGRQCGVLVPTFILLVAFHPAEVAGSGGIPLPLATSPFGPVTLTAFGRHSVGSTTDDRALDLAAVGCFGLRQEQLPQRLSCGQRHGLPLFMRGGEFLVP